MNIKCLILLSVFIPLAFIVIGTPLCVDSFNNNYNVINYFASLPLFANQTIPNKIYYLSEINDFDQHSDFLTITMNVSNNYIKNKKIYLMHNMFGYQIYADLIINGIVNSQINISRNNNLSDTKPLKRKPLSRDSKLGSAFKKTQIAKNVFNVICPFPTEITTVKEIDVYCRNNPIPMLFDGNYSFLQLFNSIRSKKFNQIQIQFNYSFFIPYNYIETPEAYIAYIGYSSKSAMFYSGVFILIIGAFSSVGLTMFLIIRSVCL